MENIGQGLGTAIVILCICCVLFCFGGYLLIDWLFIDDAIKVSEPIVPELELIIKNNEVDTVYVYRKP